MTVYFRKMLPGDKDAMHALWERSVRATHAFLSEEDIAFYSPMVREMFGLEMDFWVALEEGEILGFVGLDAGASPVKLEALFVDPAHFRKGLGRLFVAKAMELYGPMTLDVNEQNPGAHDFYTALGFKETGRSPIDGAGRPFPLIHMACGRLL